MCGVAEAQVEVREDYMRADLQGCGDDSAEADVDDGELEARGFWYAFLQKKLQVFLFVS